MKFNLLDLLLPRETKFFGYLENQTTILIDTCRSFQDMILHLDRLSDEEFKNRVAAIKDFERKGDDAERLIIDELHKTFITPLDREDIHTIATTLDKALDILNSISSKFEVYQIRNAHVNVHKFAEIILEMAVELRNLFKALAGKEDIMPFVERLHVLENTADRLFHWAMADLFDGQHPAVEVIKFKEVYEYLEGVTDCMDYVGKLVRGVKVKQG